MGTGLRAKHGGFVNEGIICITGSTTKRWIDLGVPLGTTEITAFLIGGGGGAGGGSGYASFGSTTTTNWCNDAGGGGAGYVRTQPIHINCLDTVSIVVGGRGTSGQPYEGDNEDGTTQQQTSGSGGGTSSIVYNGTTYSAGGGYASGNTPTGRSYGSTNGANGGSGGGGGGYYYSKDTWEWEDEYSTDIGYGGTNGGNGGSTRYEPEQKHPYIYSGGSGAGVSTRVKGLANMECARGGGAGGNSALGYGDGAKGSWTRQYQPNPGAVFIYWNNGGI